MKRFFHLTRLLITHGLVSSALAADSPAQTQTQTQKPLQTVTVFVGGLECAACVEVVRQTLNEVEGVTNVEIEQRLDSVANVTFDPGTASLHQLAQAVADSPRLHGQPYDSWMQFLIPDYAARDHSAKVDRWMKSVKPWADVTLMDRATGEFMLRFQPLAKKAGTSGPHGLSAAQIEQALTAPAPQGLGLTMRWVREEL